MLWASCSPAGAGGRASRLQGLQNWTGVCPAAVLGAWFSRAGPTPPVFGPLVSTLLSVTSKVHLTICQPSQAWEAWTGHLHLNYQDILAPRGPPHLAVPTEAPSGKCLQQGCRRLPEDPLHVRLEASSVGHGCSSLRPSSVLAKAGHLEGPVSREDESFLSAEVRNQRSS